MNDCRKGGLTFRKRNPQRLLMGVADRENVSFGSLADSNISKITLTTKRNKRELPRMEIAVTTCGVTSLERRETKPISNARRVTKPMKRVQEKRWTCLGAGTLEGTLAC